MRKIAREIAFMLIYEEQFNKNMDVEFSFDYLKNENEVLDGESLDKNDENFVKEVLGLYNINRESIVELVNKHLYGYEPSRVFKVDNALLYLAVTEIYYAKIPAPVAINEAVELAKKYSTEKSAKFVNGILGGIIKELPPLN